jgi:hypothetical protein
VKLFKTFVNEQILGLTEGMTIQYIGFVKAKVDTGNSAYNVLHGIVKNEENNKVTFVTVNDKQLTLPVIEHIPIHIGSGNVEERIVVELDCSIGSKQFNKVKFSIADRSKNDYPVLIGEDFIKLNGGFVNVKINNSENR